MEDMLKEAVSMGQVSEVESLLQKGVSPHITDENGLGLLHIACSVNESRIVTLLVKHGIDIEAVDETGSTGLHVACERGSIACAEILLELGAKSEVKNDKKKTPFSYIKNKNTLTKLRSIVPKPKSPLPGTTLSSQDHVRHNPSFSSGYNSPSSPATPTAIKSDGSPSTDHRNVELNALAQTLNDKTQTLLAREDDLVQREATLRSREADMKRKLNEMEAKLVELQDSKSKYELSEKQLKLMVDTHNRNEFVAAMCVVTWNSITVKTKLGAGSFACVYRGVWRGTQVAIKKPFMSIDNPTHGLMDADAIDLFCREIKLLSKLRHPNIVLLMAACLEPENMCCVMELCRSDLYTILHDPSIYLSPKKLLSFAIDAAQALLYMHTHSPALLHRDIKTSNMLISSSGELKLIDFGYASYVGETDFVYTRHKLAEKANKGTPAYMAPECLKNEEVTTKSDIFSLGTVLWELVTRKFPWAGKSPESIYAEVTTGNRLPIPDDSTFPVAYGELISACWLESPSDRPSARTVLKVLRGIRKVL